MPATDERAGDVEARQLEARLLDVIGRGADIPLEEREFEELALAVFRHQFERNPIYRGYSRARGTDPGTISSWREIPAVPTDAFKAAPLVAGDPAEAVVTFRTSGTTAGAPQRGAHHLLDTALYEAALLAGFRSTLLPDGATLPILSLVAPAREAPDSSLSFMVQCVIDRLGGAGSRSFASADALDVKGLIAVLEEAEARAFPLLLAGTSLGVAHLLEVLASRPTGIALPPGSRLMDTGGFKGIRREISREELYRGVQERLGIPGASVVNEYGMTEMSSQFYDGVVGGGSADRVYRGPGWVRTEAVDPETLEPVRAGEVGILRHLDLANLHSVVALQTADLGRIREGGGFELLGRITGATPRGCSIAMDELLQVMNSR